MKIPTEKHPENKQISPAKRMIKYPNEDSEYTLSPYIAKVIRECNHGEDYWNTLRVGIFKQITKNKEEYEYEQVGEYIRNYHSLMNTFYPFERNGQWYALYSKDYTCTRVMTLPGCKDIGGEDPHGWGFCPVEFFVPVISRCRVLEKGENFDDWKFEHTDLFAPFGFISGCVWGDDWSWKIQYLDLSKIEQGIIKREEKFGYIHLPSNITLSEAISDISDLDSDESLEKVKDTDRTYQYSIACNVTFRTSPDGKMAVFHKEHIAKNNNNAENEDW